MQNQKTPEKRVFLIYRRQKKRNQKSGIVARKSTENGSGMEFDGFQGNGLSWFNLTKKVEFLLFSNIQKI